MLPNTERDYCDKCKSEDCICWTRDRGYDQSCVERDSLRALLEVARRTVAEAFPDRHSDYCDGVRWQTLIELRAVVRACRTV